MLPRLPLLPILAALMSAATGCNLLGDDGEGCTPGVRVQPRVGDGGTLALLDNAQLALTATVELCGDGNPLDYTISWYYDADANGRLDEGELETPASREPTLRLFACRNDVGTHAVRVAAEAITAETDFELDFDLRIDAGGTPPAPPTCYGDALATVQDAENVDKRSAGDFAAVLDCLEPYLEQNICDVTASYAAGLARFAVFNATTTKRFLERSRYTPADVLDIYDHEVQPMVDRFRLVADEADENFQFFIFGKFQITAFENLEEIEGDETTYLVLQGEHDLGEVYAIEAVASFINGLFNMILAYEGFAQWMLDYPALDEVDSYSTLFLLLERVAADEQFLTLSDEGTPDGTARLLEARSSFMAFFDGMQQAVSYIRNETDNQADDLFRYWDCGSDGLCDCDYVNDDGIRENSVLDCPNNPADYEAADDDGTENNGRYDAGEPVGADRVGLPNFATVDLPSNLDEFFRQTTLVRENLRGPDALDLDELAGFPASAALEGFLIPVPEIRLSEWFLTPAHPRDLFALFKADGLDVIFDYESEFYRDAGYDGLENEDEVIVHANNVRALPLGTGYDIRTNPDPSFDDFDPFCNPICSLNDGIDNDGDSLIDGDDRLVSDGFDFDTDGGVENNLVFDWVDLNFNYAHDPGEPSEPFRDEGVERWDGEVVGAGNGHWDMVDQRHEFPGGAGILPRGDLSIVDPPNGIDQDSVQRSGLAVQASQVDALSYRGLYDSFYFFFPDPEFSDVFKFPERIVSISGEDLTENAKLHRFFGKVLELAGTFPIPGVTRVGDGHAMPVRAAYGHVCRDADPDEDDYLADEEACRASIAQVRGR